MKMGAFFVKVYETDSNDSNDAWWWVGDSTRQYIGESNGNPELNQPVFKGMIEGWHSSSWLFLHIWIFFAQALWMIYIYIYYINMIYIYIYTNLYTYIYIYNMIIYIGEEDTSLMLLSEACHTNFVVFATKSSASFCRARFSQEKKRCCVWR